MVSTTIPGIALLAHDHALDEATRQALTRRFSALVAPLLQATSAAQFKATLKKIAVDYVPFRSLFTTNQALETQRTNESVHDAYQRLNKDLWQALSTRGATALQAGDRAILLTVLKRQMDIPLLWENASTENRLQLFSAVLDGYWALLKLDLCISIVAFTVAGALRPKEEPFLHWSCLAARDALKEWESALFQHDPELRRRLTTSGKTLTTEEVERSLGI